MKIYTGTGDDGETGLFGGRRVSKASLRIGVVGELDALNASFGLAEAHDREGVYSENIRTIQSALFDIGAEIATIPDKVAKLSTAAITDADVSLLESWIDASEARVEPLKSFILPGGTPLAAFFHHTRTVSRRAERQLVALHEAEEGGVRNEVLRYVNRLSDLCFSWARDANRRANIEDVPWVARRKKQVS